MASAMYEPTPGSLMFWFETEMASEATTKNQPPDIDIIMFQSSPGVANGSSRRQKRCQPESWNTAAASRSSAGTVRSDWYRLNAMFQACDVKMAKIAAHSTPSRLPGKRAMKPVTVIERKPRIGIDCRMSSSGTITRSAVLYFAATVANTHENSERGAEREEHAQRRAQQVVGQVRTGRALSGMRFAELVGPRHLRAAEGEQRQHAEHQRQQRPVPAVAGSLDDLAREEALVEHRRSV